MRLSEQSPLECGKRPDYMLAFCCLQPLDLIQYDSWNVILPEGEFLTKVSRVSFFACYSHPLLLNCSCLPCAGSLSGSCCMC